MRVSTQVARIVSAIHQKIRMLKFSGAVPRSEPKILRTDSYPPAVSMSATRTWPVTCLVKPTLAPRSTKNVASVTMKLGNFVFTTT